MKRIKMECGLGHYTYCIGKLIKQAKEQNCIIEFEFNEIELEVHPNSYIEDIHKIYNLKRKIEKLEGK